MKFIAAVEHFYHSKIAAYPWQKVLLAWNEIVKCRNQVILHLDKSVKSKCLVDFHMELYILC